MKNNLRKKFRELYIEEFKDPNEAFQDFLLDLIPYQVLREVLVNKKRSFYYKLNTYKGKYER